MKGIGVLVLLTLLVNNIAFAGDMKEKFQNMSEKMAKAMLASDYDTMFSMYTDDAYSLPSYSPMIKGKKAMMKQAEEEAKAGLKMKEFALTTVDVFGNKDQMIQIGNYTLSIVLPGMTSPINDKGKYLTVWHKQADGSWKIKAETWNSDTNPMEAMQQKK
jgi:uncharacterized protein (TIGR02246 family)